MRDPTKKSNFIPNLIENQMGELILTGVDGLSLNKTTAEFLHDSKIGGVLLFKKNYETPRQLAELIQAIQACRPTDSPPLWVSVDQEGGQVQRLRDGFSLIPEAEKIGQLGDPEMTYQLSCLMAQQLRAVGVNLNYAPVTDILTCPTNPVMKTRTFGTTANLISPLTNAFIQGHLKEGVLPCVKHFPGHGDTLVDSHLELPKGETPLETLREREFLPFREAFSKDCPFVMMAHLLNSAVDPDFPASLSHRWIEEILRGELGYSKIVVSDDLEMQAITHHYSPEEAPRLALEAGCDLLIYRSETAAKKAVQNLKEQFRSGKLSPARITESFQRLRALKLSSERFFNLSLAPHQVGTSVVQPHHQTLLEKFKEAERKT